MGTEGVIGWFSLPTGTSPSRLLRVLRHAGYLADPPATSRYKCLFVETQDGRLARGGYRLSIGQTRGRTGWYLSGPEGEAEEAFEGDVSFRSLAPEAPGVPAPIRGLAGGRLLLPLVRLKGSAWDAHLQDPSGSRLALRAERFRAAPPLASWPTDGPPQGLLSIRLLEGNREAFLHLATYLRDRLNLPASPGDTCRVALQILDIPEPGAPLPAGLRVRPEDPLALAARKVVGQQALKMRANVQGTLEDLDPEYLHDLRVAIRRLRSALRLFAGVLGPRRSDSLRVELNWIGRLLGAVRDLDVFVLALQAQAQRLGESSAIAGLLIQELLRQREPAQAPLRTALVSRRFRTLMCRLNALASSPPPRRPRGAQGLPVAEAAPALIRKAQKRVLRLGRSIGPNSPATELHRLRILFKRLRYAGEFFQEAFVDPGSGEDPLADYLRAMARFQDCLGEHQDAVVAIARIQDLAKDMVQTGALAPERLLDLGSLIQVQREIARERRESFARLWTRFDRRSVLRRLAILGSKMPSAPRLGQPARRSLASRRAAGGSPGGPQGSAR
jgi:CHAD domain-containing protein